MMKFNLPKSWILILLFILFMAPTVLGIVLYQHPRWLPQKTTNQGRFLTPAVNLPIRLNKATWYLVFWSPTRCESTCQAQLAQLARVRLALGRQYYQVHLALMLPKDYASAALRSALNESIELTLVEPTEQQALAAFPQATVFIADPQHAAILEYSPHHASSKLHSLGRRCR